MSSHTRLLVLSFVLLVSCKQGRDASQGAAASENDHEQCGRYASALCELAGTQSSSCQSMIEVAEFMSPKACAAGLSDLDFSRTRLAAAKEDCGELIEKLCGDLGEDTQTCAMVRKDTPGFAPERCRTMLDRYDEVLADLRRMQERNAPLDEEQQAAIAAADAPSQGPTSAPVTIVEFSDFQCPYCMTVAATLGRLRDRYGDRVRFVFRQFPLSFHHDAHRAAQAALAAHAQDKFWPYHDRLFELSGKLDREHLEAEARALGLDMPEFRRALDEAEFADRVDSDIELGESVLVDATPTVFINGKRVDARDYDELSSLVDDLLSESSEQ